MSETKFVCECDKAYRSACEGLEFYQEIEGKKYCVLHCPIQDKMDDFDVALRRKLNTFDYDFRGVYFPPNVSFESAFFVSEVSFTSAIFSGNADFLSATFSRGASFWLAMFGGVANFGLAKFSGATSFESAKFNGTAYFNSVTFSGAVYFRGVEFLSRSEADFGSVIFSHYANFSPVTFSGNAIFREARFDGIADFKIAHFDQAADFSSVSFNGDALFWQVNVDDHTSFNSASFSGKADFRKTTFGGAVDFISATFSDDADFSEVTFSAALDFISAKIGSYLRFSGTKENPVFPKTASVNLHLAQITKPEQVVFHTVKLKPQWFVNVDSRKFEFTNIDWGKTTVLDDLKALESVENRHRLLSIAYRQLATNAEDNNQYGQAADFRYASMDARRLEGWRGWNIFTLDWWYWLVSGYGERIPRAAICLLVLLLGFSFLFTQVGFEMKAAPEVTPIVQEMMPPPAPRKDMPLPSFMDGLTYAMSAALFQRPEPKAYTICAKLSVGAEMILVPLQAALLALAIRRRFMR